MAGDKIPSTERDVPLPGQALRWDLCRRYQCDDPDRLWVLLNPLGFRAWLGQFLLDETIMRRLREMLRPELTPWPLVRMSDERVLDRIAELVLNERLHLHVWLRETLGVEGGAKRLAPPGPNDRVAPFPLSESGQKIAGRSDTADDPTTFSSKLDAAGQADVLAAAAQDGAPFCMQCEQS